MCVKNTYISCKSKNISADYRYYKNTYSELVQNMCNSYKFLNKYTKFLRVELFMDAWSLAMEHLQPWE